MPLARTLRITPRRTRRRPDWAGLWRRLRRTSRKAFAVLRAAPLSVQIATGAVVLLLVWSIANLAYHVAKKPTELFLPVSGVLMKAPAETWSGYAPLFRRYATPVITPPLLAALAQVESAGDPVARTYWRWRFSWNPLKLYQPASSAVGMYQITDATFAEAKRYCIHQHLVIEDGASSEAGACWFNSLYTRVIPSHAVELTAAYLDRKVATATAHARLAATPQQKEELAALIHLCGAGAGESFARHGFHLAPGERCGDHDAATYLARVNAAKRQFQRLAAAD